MKLMDNDKVAENELEVIMRVNNENVVKYFDHFELTIRNERDLQELKLCIITEYCEVDFFL